MTAVSTCITHELSQLSPRNGEIVCHCLRVSRTEINEAIDAGEVQTVKCVMRKTRAGSGCMACHCTIRRMLADAQSAKSAGMPVTGPMLCAATVAK